MIVLWSHLRVISVARNAAESDGHENEKYKQAGIDNGEHPFGLDTDAHATNEGNEKHGHPGRDQEWATNRVDFGSDERLDEGLRLGGPSPYPNEHQPTDLVMKGKEERDEG